ncbi:uncharacterized protein LOC119689802 [Teleopsis dalmanni]|uniref:uncharacterized protein LOC119689802 n=1 Tax=Teleopsis dalmanni TaxID=139649 RepID=UPI0018CCD5A8|nr:uncharacterized protein LOC119689802 [Teleopsis dalmanni]
MRSIVIFAVLLSAAAGYSPSSYISQQSLTKPKDSDSDEPQKETTASSVSATPSTPLLTTLAAVSSTVKPSPEPPTKEEETLSELPTSLPTLVAFEELESDIPKRRVITYDQRQEGQYNIRADLENFMIILIPPRPAEGLSLLNLLTKSSLSRHSSSSKSKRKHHTNSVSVQPSLGSTKYLQSLKSGSSPQFNYLSRHASDSVPSHTFFAPEQQNQLQRLSLADSLSTQRLPEFIEGRTPYHVDISASDDEQSRLHPNRQVDVLPPPYPIAHPHFIKPYHLEVEPTVIQTLPPAELSAAHHSSNNFLDTYNQLLASNLQENNGESGRSENVPSEDNGYYRVSRAIRSDNFLDTNRVTSSNSLNFDTAARRSHVPLYRADLSYGAANTYNVDVPRLPSGYLAINTNARNFDLNNDDREQNLEENHTGEIIIPPSLPIDDVLELDARGVSFLDSDAKELLSDGMERCAPGRRRDSYGVCREIEGY